MVQFKKLETTLEAGTNTHTFTDDLITDNSVIEVYTDNDDVYPVNIEQSGHSVNIEIVGHIVAVRVAITINNVISYEPVDVSAINTHFDNLDQDVSDITTSINGLTNRVLNNENDIDTINDDLSALSTMVTDLETGKQNLLIQGNNITLTPVEGGTRIDASGGSSIQEVYDDTERVIGTWFDKTLYRKTIVMSELGIGTTTIPLPNDLKMICSFNGILINKNDNKIMRVLPFADNTANNNIRVDTDGTSLRIITYASWANYIPYVTIKYTKVGD